MGTQALGVEVIGGSYLSQIRIAGFATDAIEVKSLALKDCELPFNSKMNYFYFIISPPALAKISPMKNTNFYSLWAEVCFEKEKISTILVYFFLIFKEQIYLSICNHILPFFTHRCPGKLV